MTNSNPPHIEIRTLDAFDNELLGREWQILFENSHQPSFFLSWQWIEAWLNTIKTPTTLFRFELNNTLVGLSFVTKTKLRYKLLSIEHLFIQQTGDQQQDQMWIEYNDILSKEGYEEQIWEAFLIYFDNGKDIDVITLSTAAKSTEFIQLASNSLLTVGEPVLGYSVSLSTNLMEINSYLKLLSKNTRSQIRRSISRAQKVYGALSIRKLEQHDYKFHLKRLAELHIKKWGETAEGSGFSNPYFIEFHHNLRLSLDNGKPITEILIVQAGQQLLGYLYNFVFRGQIYFYLSSINYTSDAKQVKPGLIMHTLAISYYAEQGMKTYDFLGGDAQYKRSLSTSSYEMYNIRIEKNTLKNRLIRQLRRVKQMISSLY